MIYFLRGKSSGNIKIGFSTSPDQRRATLQTAHYEELEFVGLMHGSLQDEATIHARFAKSHIRGEWYRAHADLLAYVKDNAAKPRKNVVSSLGNGDYRITFSQPLKGTMNLLLLVGSHHLRLLMDDEHQLAFAIEGKRAVLLDWLRSLGYVSKEAIGDFAANMTD